MSPRHASLAIRGGGDTFRISEAFLTFLSLRLILFRPFSTTAKPSSSAPNRSAPHELRRITLTRPPHNHRRSRHSRQPDHHRNRAPLFRTEDFHMTPLVTNGHWVGRIIHTFDKWSWVAPLYLIKKDQDGNHLPYQFKDGPLTFENTDLRDFT